MTSNELAPRVYVGTYAKYNNGSIKGAWLDLTDYADEEAFLAACAELHSDESDPELMFQDFEGFPRSFYGESGIDSDIWDWLAMSDDDKELLSVYRDNIDSNGDLDAAQEAFCGKYDREIDWAYETVDDGGYLEGASDFCKQYFDYESFLHDAQVGGDVTFIRHNGDFWAFRNN